MENIFYKKNTEIENSKIIELKEEIITCFNHSLDKASPEYLTERIIDNLNIISELKNKNITVFAFGKASGYMLKGLANALNLRKVNGLLATNVLPSKFTIEIKVFNSSHPLPNNESLNAGNYAVKLSKNLDKDDVVVCLISGGGSALFETLNEDINLELQQKLSESLLKLGMEDHEINLFRKLFSGIKGEKLAKLIAPAKIINLIISDDLYNSLEAISSGPTVKSTITKSDLRETYKKWNLSTKLDSNVRQHIEKLINDFDGNSLVSKQDIKNHIILDNSVFLRYLRNEFERYNDSSEIVIYESKLSDSKEDTLKFAKYIKNQIKALTKNQLVIISGGEIPINVINDGLGGRNQHFAAEILNEFIHYQQWVFASIATDGQDYIKGIAGAMVSSIEANICKKKNINIDNYIKSTNTYELHDLIGSHIFCKKGTGFNVSDIYVFIYYKDI